jgi:hypothetical protein
MFSSPDAMGATVQFARAVEGVGTGKHTHVRSGIMLAANALGPILGGGVKPHLTKMRSALSVSQKSVGCTEP